MILSAQSIRKREGIITPFTEKTIFNGMSYGLTGAGYDIRIAEHTVVPVGRGVLASSLEHFRLPNDIQGRVCDKSSWARKMLAVQNTVLEPGWYGYLTLELTNHGTQEIIIPKGAPIAQVVFHLLDEPTELPYKGKYQAQKAGAQPAIHEVGVAKPTPEEAKQIDEFMRSTLTGAEQSQALAGVEDSLKKSFLSTEEAEGFHPVTGEIIEPFKAYYTTRDETRDINLPVHAPLLKFLRENNIGWRQDEWGKNQGYILISKRFQQKVKDYSASLMDKAISTHKGIIDEEDNTQHTEQKL